MGLKEIRERHEGFRWTIADVPFTEEQKEVILEYLAMRYWAVLEVLEPAINSGGWKGYDPLTIRNGVALSYVFDLEDGGRRHPYRDLSHLEEMLLNEAVKEIRRITGNGEEEDE